MDISQDHKSRKRDGYWTNLVDGETGLYKAEAIDALIGEHLPRCDDILDIGCGTSVIGVHLRDRLAARRLVFMDYDEAILDAMRAQLGDDKIEWKLGDIFTIGAWGDRFDLVLLLDMIHEVYSFYGRPVREVVSEIDHAKGQAVVRDALEQVAMLVRPGGGIVISDNVLAPAKAALTVRIRTEAAYAAVTRFLAEYPSRRIAVDWTDDRTMRIDSHDFCILLTQYNKIKSGQDDRWNVEKFEIHQYMTQAEFAAMFEDLGFTLHALVGTPEGAAAEWDEDFAVEGGALPDKRITLIAVKDA